MNNIEAIFGKHTLKWKNVGYRYIFSRKIASLLFILAISLNPTCIHANPDTSQVQFKILFIGSSYFNFNNLPNLFRNFAINSGKEVYIDQLIPSGRYLEDHANSSHTELKINETDWDYIILQGVGSLTAYPQIITHHPVKPALVTLRNKIKANSGSTKMVFCLPWAFEDGMTWLQGWNDTYEDMQQKIYNNTLKYADEVGFEIAPVGWAWNTVLKEKNYPMHYLHKSDWNHPSLKGSYLMACVIYSTIFVESTIGIPFYSDLSIEDANYFKTIGSNMVLDSLEIWNINTTFMDTNDLSIPNNHYLHQNYPNPFNPITTITYDLRQEAEVIIQIYSLLGHEIKTIKNGLKSAGQYQINWDGTDNSGKKVSIGAYLFQLKAGDYIQTRKMVLLK